MPILMRTINMIIWARYEVSVSQIYNIIYNIMPVTMYATYLWLKDSSLVTLLFMSQDKGWMGDFFDSRYTSLCFENIVIFYHFETVGDYL